MFHPNQHIPPCESQNLGRSGPTHGEDLPLIRMLTKILQKLRSLKGKNRMICRVTSAFVVCAFLSTASFADTVGKWSKGEINGFTRYWTTNNVGANFVIWCHPQRMVNGTLLHIEIDGKTPTPNSRIKLIMDQEVLELPVNEQGYVDSDCATCSDRFGYVWHRLRASRTMAVKFQDKRYAGFSLKGATKILPGPVCPTDWQKKNPNS